MYLSRLTTIAAHAPLAKFSLWRSILIVFSALSIIAQAETTSNTLATNSPQTHQALAKPADASISDTSTSVIPQAEHNTAQHTPDDSLQDRSDDTVQDTSEDSVQDTSEDSVQKASVTPTEASPNTSLNKKLLNSRAYISEQVGLMADRMDQYFGENHALEETNKSWIRLNLDHLYDVNDGHDYKVRTKFRVYLPATKQRYKIFFENEPEEDTDFFSESNPGGTLPEDDDEQSAALGIAFKREIKDLWNIEANVGAKFSSPIDPYIRIISRNEWLMSDSWYSDWRNRFTQYYDAGYSADSQWNLVKRLAKRKLLRFRTKLDWEQAEDFRWSETVTVSKKLNKRSGQAWDLGVIGDHFSHNKVQRYYLGYRYRRDIHQKWLFLNISPQVYQDREFDFNTDWSIKIGLEIYFGKDIYGEI